MSIQTMRDSQTPPNTDSDGIILEESELLLELVRSIVRSPEKVSVHSAKGRGTTVLTVTVDPSDRGQVIGREHRTLDAIMHLFEKAAGLDHRRVVIQLEGEDLRREERPRNRTRRGPVREYRSRR